MYTPVIHKLIATAFHWIWYRSRDTWQKNTFLGYPILQLPLDLWLYQELVHRVHPSFVLQTGVADGGSILFFAHLLDMIGADKESIVIGIDLKLSPLAQTLQHPRIHLIEGDSTSDQTIEEVKKLIKSTQGFVVLDSDHSYNHVLKEIKIYSSFVKINSYLVVEDTNLNGHPVNVKFGPGPLEAVTTFLKLNDWFVQDDQVWSRNMISFHHHGWLRRIK